MTAKQKTLEAEELERLGGIVDLEPETFFNCVFYACYKMMARACVERQVSTKMGRGNGAKALPIHQGCSSGECAIGRVVAEKITVVVVPHRVMIGSYRGKKRAKAKRKATAGPRFCNGDDCSKPIRWDNKRGFCTVCRMKPAYRQRRTKKTTAA